MPTTPEGFAVRIDALKAQLVQQGRRVQSLVEVAYDAAFARDEAGAARAIQMDEDVDRVDVEVEREAVQILTTACGEGAALAPDQVRLMLTIVKVNNELERIADVGVLIAELIPALIRCATGSGGGTAPRSPLPPTFRVLANSILGILRDSVTAFQRIEPELAKVVLLSEQAVGEFKRALVNDAQRQLSAGQISVETANALHEVAAHSVVIADHCTNIAEQVLYTATGRIMRHFQGRWEEVQFPPRTS
jgi:phosphate transport system protein